MKRNCDIFKMFIILIVVFYICFLLILSLYVFLVFGFYELLKINYIWFIVFLLYFLNGVINLIIYFIFNESFCDGIKVVLFYCKCFRSFVYFVEIEVVVRKKSIDDGNDGLRFLI